MSDKYVYIFGGAIGDALLGVHLGRLLSNSVPGARLRVLSTRKNNFVRDLLAPISFVEYRELPKESLRSWLVLCTWLGTRQKVGYFIPLSGVVPLWWKIIGWAATRRSGCLVRQKIVPDIDNIFDIAQNMLEKLGVKVSSQVPHLEPGLFGEVSRHVPYIVFHFSAASIRRSVPVSHARDILKAAHEAFPKHRLYLTGSADDYPRMVSIGRDYDVDMLVDSEAAILFKTLVGADAYVGVDTGVTHLAAHAGVPTIVLGNLSNPCWLPYYSPHAVVLFDRKRCGCRGDKTGNCEEKTEEGVFYRCLFDIKTTAVLKELHTILS